MKALSIDTGGTHVKILATEEKEHREFESGPRLTPELMASGLKKLADEESYNLTRN